MNVPLATPVETERALMWLAALSAAVMKDLSQAQGGCGVQGYSLGSQAQGPMQDLKGSLPQLLHP